MFGYVIPDKPNMFMKDYSLYRAYYCGLCKAIGERCGETMRFLTNYDVTFLSLLVRGARGDKANIKSEGCILAPLKKKPVLKSDALLERIVDVNTLLAHYKCVDDVNDDRSFSKKFIDGAVIKRHYRRAEKRESELAALMARYFKEQSELEKANEPSVDKVAHPFGVILKETVKSLSGESYTDSLGELSYHLGRFVYILDAIDDVESDFKKKEYNHFLVGYHYESREKFDCDRGEEIKFILYSTYNAIKDSYSNVKMISNEGVVTNVLWYGLKSRIDEILGRKCKCKKTRI